MISSRSDRKAEPQPPPCGGCAHRVQSTPAGKRLAYRRLRELTGERSTDPELYARLYWLLVLEPGLDPDRDRRQWLSTGLAASGFDPRLLELYDRELQGDPEEVLRPRCRTLLERRTVAASFVRFSARCWEFAGLLGQWQSIATDMQSLRHVVAGADRTLWARLLLAGAEQFLWQDDARARDQLVQACRRELEEYSEEHWELRHELDRCDFLAELTAGCRQLAISPRLSSEFVIALCGLLRRGWVESFNTIRPRLLLLVRPMAEDPRRALGDLDRVCRTSSVVLAQFNSLVEALYRQRHEPAADAGADRLTGPVETFFRRTLGRFTNRSVPIFSSVA